MRYSKTERQGVNKANEIVTNELEWVFREQTISDVGIDAIIEEVIENNPTGNLIAVQIKSGEGNFHISEKRLTHYVSNIHYNYWLNLNIPIILIGYLPNTNETFWEEINEFTLKKTKKKWKIDIPKSKKLNGKSIKKLVELLKYQKSESQIFDIYKGSAKPESIYDVAERISCLTESKNSINNIIEIIGDISIKTKEFNEKLKDFTERGLSDEDPEVKSSFKGYGRTLNIISRRLENEIEIFSKTFSEGFFSYELITTMNVKINDILNVKSHIKEFPSSVKLGINGLKDMKGGILTLPKKYSTLKEGRQYLLNTIDYLIYEFNEAGTLIEKLTTKNNNEG